MDNKLEPIKAFPAEDMEIEYRDHIDKLQKDIPLSKVIELRRKNLSLQQIADICKCSKQNIHMRLKDIEEFEDFPLAEIRQGITKSYSIG